MDTTDTASIITTLHGIPRFRQYPVSEKPTIIDRLLWEPMPFDNLGDYQASLPPNTQLSLFHPCGYCGIGGSFQVDTYCNHCHQYLTKRVLARKWWSSGWRFKLGVSLWEINYRTKEARRKALLGFANLLLGAVIEVGSTTQELRNSIPRR